MNADDFLLLGQHGIETAIWISAPILALGLVTGLMVSIMQAATQINDSAIAFIPKIAASILSIIVFGHFMLGRLVGFTAQVFTQIASLGQ